MSWPTVAVIISSTWALIAFFWMALWHSIWTKRDDNV